MNKATYTQILNRRLISYAREHGLSAYPQSGGDETRVGVIVEIPWYKPGTTEQGIEYACVKTFASLRKELGY